jgi:hypothetical protein
MREHDWKPGDFDVWGCRRCGVLAFVEALPEDDCDPH